MLTRRWFWCDWTLAQSLVSSFDQGKVVWMRPDAGQVTATDQTLSSKVTGRWVPESGQHQ